MTKNYQSVGNYEDEKYTHQKIAKNCKKGIVEIGVLYGETTKTLLDNSNVSVYGIDPIIPDSMNVNLVGDINKINNLVSEFDGRFIFIKDYSFNVVKNWNIELDYIFIDGDHKYESVKDDFESWFKHLAKDGYVSIHDSSANRGGPYWWDGPSKLADELIVDNRLEYIETIYTLTVFRKK